MNKTEALRLADELEAPVGTQSTYSAMQQAAAELRRLHAENASISAALAEPVQEPDLFHCPKCGGPADNGHDRSIPPNPYLCTKCMAEPVHKCPNCASLEAQNNELDRKLAELEREGEEQPMTCPECEYHKQRAQLWRHEAYRQGGAPLPWSPDEALLKQALAFTMRDFTTVQDFKAARAVLHDALRERLKEKE